MFRENDKVKTVDGGEAFVIVEVFNSKQGVVYRAKSLVDELYGYYEEDELEPIGGDFEHEIAVENNVAMVRLYDVSGGGRREVARGHGHIIHDGAVGYAQAIGFAFNRIVRQLGGYPEREREYGFRRVRE